MKRKRVEVVIFDLGGTLYNPLDIGNATRTFLQEIGIDHMCHMEDTYCRRANNLADEWLDEHMLGRGVNPYWEPSVEEWVEYDKIVLRTLGLETDVEKYAMDYQKQWDLLLSEIRPKLADHVEEELENLRSQGLKLAIASNRFGDPSSFLEEDGILQHFSAVEYTAVPGYRKPSPYMLLKAAADLKMNPMKCAYVGNIVHYDVAAATRAQMQPILLTWCNPEEGAMAPKEVAIIEDIRGVMEVLE
ncbi:MAG: HAD family hydrolase [Candidatus Thorarchaeota archaeon]|nr:HAD family hydrolase [Candidatus Thorarchaeota archaeon]